MSGAALRTLLGCFVVLHALAHAVLPLRGSIGPGPDYGDWVPVGLYTFSMLGFVAAALGLFGTAFLKPFISPLLVVSSAFSLTAILRFSDPGLWIGAVGDAALLIVGLWRGYAGWPANVRRHGRVWHAAAVVVGTALFAYVAITATLWPWHRSWGSTEAELTMSLPGDPPARNRHLEIQHAVTIDAPPENVWPWLMQLGQDRAGFYSHDWLERAFGVDVHNASEIRSEWQPRGVGDLVRATQPSYLGSAFGPNLGWRVMALEPPRAMVLDGWGAFVLLPTQDGRTRFVIRSPSGRRDVPAWLAAVDFLSFQLPHFIMERRMMLTIKALAEGGSGPTHGSAPPQS